MIYANGNVYIGAWKDDKFHGFGKDTVPNKYTYEGNFNMGKWDGYGTVHWNSGSSYSGNFKNQ